MLSTQKIIVILFGSLLIACGIDFFLVPFKVLDGGLIGIALIINYLFKIKIGTLMIIASLPILILTWIQLRKMFYSSLLGMVISSFLIDLLEPFQYYFLYYVELTPFTSSVLGGFLLGAGIGIMLRYEVSTGGTDLLAQIMSMRSFMNVGIIIFVSDAVIISLGGLLLSMETFILSILTVTAGGIATSICTMK
ncbi:hypothetical protein GC093_08895 [Paenibacillus sp. LMG 31456]|uniref:YitT family protein n=1 Tax=Paenibacillus foliorum TaxID=2654974 RepID=A0A972GSE9_9BACL|nr:YitT family protein [Paenibacillus foliorum]NOU93333.1 hypothetical protein [Paenibacillus foliorum]